MPEKQLRNAKLALQRAGGNFELTASVPFDITPKEIGTVHESIVERIKALTGCPCLSGQVRVVLEGRFDDVINVNLEVGGQL
jgi:hypothetical protein